MFIDATDERQRLVEASDLLVMLEELVDGLEKKSVGVQIPWGGIRLTLAHARENVQRSLAQAPRASEMEGETRTLSSGTAAPLSGPAVSALAGRVQRVPAPGGGRVRELVESAAESAAAFRAEK